MALDAGTTSNRCIIFDHACRLVCMVQKELKQYYPKSGWVEHHADEIFDGILSVAREALLKSGISAEQIAAIGITNQRETTIVWDRHTGQPICPAIVWQCRRTADICERLKTEGYTELFHERTGLLADAYFSVTKLAWILDHIEGARGAAEAGHLLFGTVETWLIWKLTGGRVHVTDYSNASRTMMYNIHKLCWDREILDIFQIPESMLPEVVSSGMVYGACDTSLFGSAIPIAGAAGDQQAALFGQQCRKPGMVKNTYGTGGFLLMNTGRTPVTSANGLVTTIAWGIDGAIDYALEGSVFTAGAAIQWLRDGLGIIDSAKASEEAAGQVEDTHGCYFVPAFTGLGAPYWDAYARGTLVGLTRGVNRCHIVRAALESIAYQVNDVLKVMEQDSSYTIRSLRVDGGASANDLLMQLQADISDITVIRPSCVETTAMGAAFFAGLTVGFWDSPDEITASTAGEREFVSKISDVKRKECLAGWDKAVQRSLDWA